MFCNVLACNIYLAQKRLFGLADISRNVTGPAALQRLPSRQSAQGQCVHYTIAKYPHRFDLPIAFLIITWDSLSNYKPHLVTLTWGILYFEFTLFAYLHRYNIFSACWSGKDTRGDNIIKIPWEPRIAVQNAFKHLNPYCWGSRHVWQSYCKRVTCHIICHVICYAHSLVWICFIPNGNGNVFILVGWLVGLCLSVCPSVCPPASLSWQFQDRSDMEQGTSRYIWG